MHRARSLLSFPVVAQADLATVPTARPPSSAEELCYKLQNAVGLLRQCRARQACQTQQPAASTPCLDLVDLLTAALGRRSVQL